MKNMGRREGIVSCKVAVKKKQKTGPFSYFNYILRRRENQKRIKGSWEMYESVSFMAQLPASIFFSKQEMQLKVWFFSHQSVTRPTTEFVLCVSPCVLVWSPSLFWIFQQKDAYFDSTTN